MEEPDIYVIAGVCPLYSDSKGHCSFTVPPHPLVPVPVYGDQSPLRAISFSTGAFASSEAKLFRSMMIVAVVQGVVEMTDSVLGCHVFSGPCAFLLDPGAGVLLKRVHSSDAVVVDMELRTSSSSSSPNIVSSMGCVVIDKCHRFSWPHLSFHVDVFSLTSSVSLPQMTSDRSVECTIFVSGEGDVSIGASQEAIAPGTVTMRQTNVDSPHYCIHPSSQCLGARVLFRIQPAVAPVAPPNYDMNEKMDYARGAFFKPVARVEV